MGMADASPGVYLAPLAAYPGSLRNPKGTAMADNEKMTVEDFLLAAQRGDRAALERALAAGMKVNAIDTHGNSALMYAAAAGQAATCQWLVDQGIDKDTVNNWGLGARDWSKWAHDVDAVRRIVY